MKEGDKVSITKDIVLPILMGIISGLLLSPIEKVLDDNNGESPEANATPTQGERSGTRPMPKTSRNRGLSGHQHPHRQTDQIDFDFDKGTGTITNSTIDIDNVTSVLLPRRFSSVKFQSPSVTPLKSSETAHQSAAVSASSTGYAAAFDEEFIEIIQASVNIAKEPVPEPVPGFSPESIPGLKHEPSPESVPRFKHEPSPESMSKSVPNPEPIPEPLTILGSFTALGIGIAIKKRAARRSHK